MTSISQLPCDAAAESSTDATAGGASVIAKVRVILEALPGAGDVITISELAREVGLPKSTVSRICAELISWGVVARIGQAVQLGPRLSVLGRLAPVEQDTAISHAALCEVAYPHMVDLHAQVRRGVSLSVLAETETMCIARVAGQADLHRTVEVGGRGPAHLTSAGRALLAHGSPAETELVFARPLQRRTRYSMVNRELLLRELDQVRRCGVATIHEEMSLGRSSMAVPVLSASGRAIAAIAITGPDGSFGTTAEQALRRCGALISQTVGERSDTDDRREVRELLQLPRTRRYS